MRGVILAVGLAMVGTGARAAGYCIDPAGDTPLEHQLRALSICIVGAATKLELSGETPDSVATAAAITCGTDIYATGRLVGICRAVPTETVVQDLDKTEREIAIRVVVEIRAARHAPKK